MTAEPSPEALNDRCPISSKPVAPDAQFEYRGHPVGFCKPSCRDDFAVSVETFDRLIDERSGPLVVPREVEGDWMPGAADPSLAVLKEEVLRASGDLVSGPVAPRISIEESRARVAAIDLDRPVGLPQATREAAELMRDGDLSSASARCFGYFNPTAAWPGVIADALAAARNPQMCVVTHAPASVAMERRVVAWMLERLGFPQDATGNFTSGGSEANATALLVALVRANADFAEEGLSSFDGTPCFYASADSHLAWIKIARAAGLGRKAVRLVETSGDGRLDPEALREHIERDLLAGYNPFMLAATAGTTNAGEIDPLHECRAIADDYGIHLHVDAAWAGALVVDPKRRALLDGIELADSVTIDAHKWLSVPMGAGMVFVRDLAAVAQAFAVTTGYMPAGDGADAYLMSNQWSRRFIGLRLWMMLRATGAEAYGRMFDRQFELADYLRAELPRNGWRVRNHSVLPVVLFEDAQGGRSSRELASALEADGQTWLGCVDFEGRTLLRACVTSFLSSREDVDLLLERLAVVREG